MGAAYHAWERLTNRKCARYPPWHEPVDLEVTMKRYTIIVYLALFTVLGCMLAAHASAAPCTYPACAVQLTAKPKAQRWATPQRFGQVAVSVSVEAAGRLLPRTPKGECGAVFHGPHRLRIHVEVCGRGAVPIRVFYRAATRQRFLIAYEA